MKDNPYSPMFGTEPSQVIPRTTVVTEIVETFGAKIPPRWSTSFVACVAAERRCS